MALAGKEMGTDVGCWFGPSIAAGAIKTLVHAFPEAGLGVSIAVDGSVYQSDVYSASSPVIGSPTSSSRDGHRRRKGERGWGGRAVLVLVGIRLGIDGVNPIYYETIKVRNFLPALYRANVDVDMVRHCIRSLRVWALQVVDLRARIISWGVKLIICSTWIHIMRGRLFR